MNSGQDQCNAMNMYTIVMHLEVETTPLYNRGNLFVFQSKQVFGQVVLKISWMDGFTGSSIW